MKELTNEQWWAISNYASQPAPLREIELEAGFLYSREYGVFYVSSGYHQIVLATLYAWQRGLEMAGDGLIELDMTIEEMAEEMLNTGSGIAFRSNVGKDVVYTVKLNYAEKSYFTCATEEFV